MNPRFESKLILPSLRLSANTLLDKTLMERLFLIGLSLIARKSALEKTQLCFDHR